MANGGDPPQQPPPGGYPPPGGGQQYPPQQPPPGGQYPPQQPPPGGYPPPGGQPPPGGYPPPGQQYATIPVAPWGAPLASWGKRVGAAIIDAFVVGIPAVIIMFAAGVGAFASADLDCVFNPATGVTECTGGDSSFFVAIALTQGIPLLVFAVYGTFMNGSERGQTVGKMALKIQVRDEATGGPIGYGKAFLRWLVGAGLSLVTCGLGGLVDVLFPLWDNKRQTIHDKAVSSLVVELPQ